MKRLVLAVLAVFILAGIASAQTTMNMTGFIRVQGEMNNFGYGPNSLNGASTTFTPTLKKDDKSAAFVDQRARMFFNLKSGDNLGGTFAYEIDTRWGQPATYGTTKPTGGGNAGADAVNLETKHIYMWYNLTPDFKLTAGIQPYSDEFNGITFFSEDLAGIKADYKLSKDSSLMVGYFLLKDSSAASGITDGVFYIPVTYKQNLGDGKLALNYAYFKDSEGNTRINAMAKPLSTVNSSLNTYSVNYLGATYNGKAGNVDYYASLLYNFGSYGGDGDISGFALQAGGDFKVGAGKLRARLLYTSGDNDSTDNDYDGLVVATAYDLTASIPLCCNDLIFLVRALEESISHSAAILQDASGYGRGVTLGYISYDQNISDKTNLQFTLAHAMLNEDKNLNGGTLGTEIDIIARYKFEKNLSLTAGFGYLMLGDAYDKTATDQSGKDPSDPYKFFARLTYSF